MRFRVLIPEHVRAGQKIRIQCPDGTEANVKIPKGLKSGDSFIFEMSVDQLNNPKALLDSLEEKTSAEAASDDSKSKPSKSTTTTEDIITKGFLDCEIVNLKDLVWALGVGLLIGTGMMIGFLGGVLYVTKDIPPAVPQNMRQPMPFQTTRHTQVNDNKQCYHNPMV